ncbi:substrate-binding domain-containing protein [Polyangium mundeleinium]|uniref:Substrate-binding domain-containing protein n=1 Tax=Polyangium mundeleinium TaxID=2995306 RepID=A0ABT5F1Q2_9BACT|nr:substrate-binding domain-containing protein [Polyangium mundeleinium]MDC0747087.1 substrate-binding domain-containing protein [Polyangium mundeleinium]
MASAPDKPRPTPSAGDPFTLRDAAGLVVVVSVLGSLGYAFVREQLALQHIETPLIVDVKTTTTTQTDLCGPLTRDGRPEVISMLYSNDKREWIEEAADRFAKLCPNIQVKITAMGDIQSANAILSGEQTPTLWAPADELVLRYLDVRWQKEKGHGEKLFDMAKRTSIARSPLVFLLWDDRRQVLEAVAKARPPKQGPWVEYMCPLVPTNPRLTGMAIEDMVPGKWIDWYNPILPAPQKEPPPWRRKAEPKPAEEEPTYRAPFPTIGQIRSWGRMKFAHTSPTRSASGLEALYLMAYDYVLPPSERSGGEKAGAAEFQRAFTEKRQAFGAWLRRCEAGLDAAPESASLLTDTIFNVGGSRYDGVVTYEHNTFSIFHRFDRFASAVASMRVLYPQPTIMNDHPVVFLKLKTNITEAREVAAGKWVDYLLGEATQKRAIEFGFRPANPAVSIRDYDSPQNSFLRFRRYRVQFEDELSEPPRLDGDMVYDLVRVWEDATGRN